jgi:hypothetical protein
MHGLGLKTTDEWREWCKSDQRPEDIPTVPWRIYKDQWRGMTDWLGYYPIENRWRSFEEAREYVRGLGLNGQVEWREWCKSGQKPEDIPTAPDRSYKKEWRGYPDWLGTSGKWYRAALLALLEDLRPRLPYLEERELYAILQQGGVMPKLRKALGKTSPLKVLKDLKENEGRGIEEALRETSDTEDEVSEENILEGDLPEDEVLKAAEELKNEHAFEEDTVLDSSESLPTLGLKESLHAVDELAGLSYGLDDEVAEYLVSNRVAGLWVRYINEGQGAVHEALEGEGGHYFGLIRTRFYKELEGVESLEVPKEWSFAVDGKAASPNVMQRHTAWEVLTKKRVGNWSGPGAGKTLSGVLASRVVGCTNTLILTNNATVAGWCRQIRDAFPDSVVRTGPAYPVASRFNYTVLNYEKFQQQDRAALVRHLAGLGIDFVILDEVQLVKQRDYKASLRRKAIEALISELAERNPDLRVLGMSATPVINNLQVARKLLEVVTGHKYSELNTRPTVNNALAVHRSLMVNGFRYRPRYELEIRTETVEVTRNDFLPDLLGARGVLGLEQTLLPAKLDAGISYVRRGTVIYTHFVDGIVGPIRQHLEDRGFRVGLYTGPDKSGLEPFLSGNIDVLVGSKPIGTGLDGLQAVCDRMIMVSLPWTGAEYEQTVGRIRRQGSAFGSVSVIVPQVVLEYEGDVWSWDKGRMAAIEYKRTLSDCAVDGRIPETVRISEKELLEQSREALERWIERVGEEGMLVIEREKLTVPLPPDVREKVMVRRGDFSTINNRWSTSNSETVHERLKADPSEWYLYHTLYREAREDWSELPAKHIAAHLWGRPDLQVGDFGCGECLLKEALPGHEVVGLDHVAVDNSVIACDMAHTPLDDGSLGAVVFSLSLLGRNWADYLAEAHRVLKPFGLLFVAEPARRWVEERLEQAVKEHGFNLMFSYQRDNFHYLGAVKGVV